jgi:5-methylcytosine-specific restriction endonuclease McrA
VPAAVRRAVFERDGGRCSYVDSSGRRCAETHRLELHHLKPFAEGGEHTVENLALRCAAHNALAAEEDFGREFVEGKRDGVVYESFASQSQSASEH